MVKSVTKRRSPSVYDSGSKPKNRVGDFFTKKLLSYDPVDQVAGVKYDTTNPNSTATGADRSVSYSYDATGNRTSVADSVNGTSNYTTNNLNQYTTVGGATLGYDLNGNLGSGNNGIFLYDAQNRALTASVGTNTDQFSYDSKNWVVEREVNTTITYLIYDGWDLIEERGATGNVLATYVHGVRQDEILSKTTSTSTIYYHHNALGSVTDLTNASGVVVEKYKYDAFGKPTITDGLGNPLTASAQGNRFMFTGREYLEEVNLYDYRNRMYSADLGRFLQTDPLRFDAGDVNVYRYCGNNVLNLTDGMGLVAKKPVPRATSVPIQGPSMCFETLNGSFGIGIGGDGSGSFGAGAGDDGTAFPPPPPSPASTPNGNVSLLNGFVWEINAIGAQVFATGLGVAAVLAQGVTAVAQGAEQLASASESSGLNQAGEAMEQATKTISRIGTAGTVIEGAETYGVTLDKMADTAQQAAENDQARANANFSSAWSSITSVFK